MNPLRSLQEVWFTVLDWFRDILAGREKYPPISPRTRVRTTAPNLAIRHQWTDQGWASKKWGVRGRVIGHHDSHGLCYDVRHEDGTRGCYDPSEIEVI